MTHLQTATEPQVATMEEGKVFCPLPTKMLG